MTTLDRCGLGDTGPVADAVGRVTLVGAGPGGADLITIRGAAALAAADVVVYDRLADPELLELAPTCAERIAVGKAKGEGVDQDDINAILVDRALRGRHVVRLKGGDPFVFGRGSEERAAVEAAGIPCEVVPGVSASLGAPALAGIPLTHRGMSASFTVLSGHRIPDADHDWGALARSSSTLVVMMGATTAVAIASRLLAEGRPADEPVAAIHRAGTPAMDVATMRLDHLAEHGCPFPAPTVLVIGNVAAFAHPTARRFVGSVRSSPASGRSVSAERSVPRPLQTAARRRRSYRRRLTPR